MLLGGVGLTLRPFLLVARLPIPAPLLLEFPDTDDDADAAFTSAASDDDCSNLHSAGADASASFSLLTSVVISALVLSSLCFMLLRCVGQRLR